LVPPFVGSIAPESANPFPPHPTRLRKSPAPILTGANPNLGFGTPPKILPATQIVNERYVVMYISPSTAWQKANHPEVS
jgi:hypothetical protein